MTNTRKCEYIKCNNMIRPGLLSGQRFCSKKCGKRQYYLDFIKDDKHYKSQEELKKEFAREMDKEQLRRDCGGRMPWDGHLVWDEEGVMV